MPDKLMQCPKAKECKLYPGLAWNSHCMPHEPYLDCQTHRVVFDCPACVPCEPDPCDNCNKAEMKGYTCSIAGKPCQNSPPVKPETTSEVCSCCGKIIYTTNEPQPVPSGQLAWIPPKETIKDKYKDNPLGLYIDAGVDAVYAAMKPIDIEGLVEKITNMVAPVSNFEWYRAVIKQAIDEYLKEMK
ncbi:MAG: hypothetical protein PHW28_06775 [Mesotoga sp.]|nr:hypothetical protein [Mesotoga sp.]